MSILVTIEGIDGAGKTTQAALLRNRLASAGRKVLLVREPGSTALGEELRPLTRKLVMSPLAEAMLFAAARAELYHKIILPALARGCDVVSDRGPTSTLAYQGYGYDAFDTELQSKLRDINAISTRERSPDLQVLLNLRPQDALARKPADTQDKFETADLEFRQNVANGYLATANPMRDASWSIVNGMAPVSEVAELIWQDVKQLIDAIEDVYNKR